MKAGKRLSLAAFSRRIFLAMRPPLDSNVAASADTGRSQGVAILMIDYVRPLFSELGRGHRSECCLISMAGAFIKFKGVPFSVCERVMDIFASR